MLKTLRTIAGIGIVSEPSGEADDALRVRDALQAEILAVLGRALCIRQVDAGSCNGCELEIHALNNPVYNIEGLGIRFVASPRHADLLLVTGPVAANMETALCSAVIRVPPVIAVAMLPDRSRISSIAAGETVTPLPLSGTLVVGCAGSSLVTVSRPAAGPVAEGPNTTV